MWGALIVIRFSLGARAEAPHLDEILLLVVTIEVGSFSALLLPTLPFSHILSPQPPPGTLESGVSTPQSATGAGMVAFGNVLGGGAFFV